MRWWKQIPGRDQEEMTLVSSGSQEGQGVGQGSCSSPSGSLMSAFQVVLQKREQPSLAFTG